MHPADLYELARRDRQRAERYLLCYDGPGLWRLAESCTRHLYERFAMRVPPECILATWRQVSLVSEQQAQSARPPRSRQLGE